MRTEKERDGVREIMGERKRKIRDRRKEERKKMKKKKKRYLRARSVLCNFG